MKYYTEPHNWMGSLKRSKQWEMDARLKTWSDRK